MRSTSMLLGPDAGRLKMAVGTEPGTLPRGAAAWSANTDGLLAPKATGGLLPGPGASTNGADPVRWMAAGGEGASAGGEGASAEPCQYKHLPRLQLFSTVRVFTLAAIGRQGRCWAMQAMRPGACWRYKSPLQMYMHDSERQLSSDPIIIKTRQDKRLHLSSQPG